MGRWRVWWVAFAAPGCTSPVPVVGLDQSTRLCPQGQIAYFYEGKEVGVCMDQEHANFMACMRQLGVDEEASKLAKESAQSLAAGYASAEVKAEQASKESREYRITMVSQGPIAEARGQALRACADAFRKAEQLSVVPPLDPNRQDERRSTEPPKEPQANP